jgi:DNA adenine methylase
MSRTPLTYYGGKQLLASRIVAMMPPHRAYIEPFCGGAAVLFQKWPAERETLNDADERITRFWRTVRDRPEELAAAIAATPYGRQEWRESRLAADDDLECARRLLVEFDQSFSRSCSSWSVPSRATDRRARWQPGTWRNLPPKILAAAERLAGVALEHGDALELIPRWDQRETVIYADPPYTGPHRIAPCKRYRHDDDNDLWPRLIEVLLAVQHADVILSGYPCEEAVALEAAGWQQARLPRKRCVQARAGNRLDAAPETVWLSPGIRGRAPMTLWEDRPA